MKGDKCSNCKKKSQQDQKRYCSHGKKKKIREIRKEKSGRVIMSIFYWINFPLHYFNFFISKDDKNFALRHTYCQRKKQKQDLREVVSVRIKSFYLIKETCKLFCEKYEDLSGSRSDFLQIWQNTSKFLNDTQTSV